MISREDQRENNNLPQLSPPQNQGRMLVIDESKAASELLVVAKSLMAASTDISDEVRISRIRQYLLRIQEFVFKHRTSRPESVVEVSGKEVEELKWQVQRALDLT